MNESDYLSYQQQRAAGGGWDGLGFDMDFPRSKTAEFEVEALPSTWPVLKVGD